MIVLTTPFWRVCRTATKERNADENRRLVARRSGGYTLRYPPPSLGAWQGVTTGALPSATATIASGA
jgi:hypothetical protein